MGVRTLLRYLIGDRAAILEIASSPRALWLGLLFVLSAGFAREYDGEDLTREPWHLLIPLAASLVSSFLLFVLLDVKLKLNDVNCPPFLSRYRAFLTLFWMTAPLAWLYAIPYERFLSPGDAVQANLYTLGLVAAWRVALMVRVAQVLMDYHPLQAIFLVMSFADMLALLAVYMMPKPTIFAVMGGIRLTEAEQVVRGATFRVGLFGIVSLPLWLLGGLWAMASGKPTWQSPRDEPAAVPNRPLWALATLSLAVWALVLPTTQAEQRLRYGVERDLKGGRIEEALAVMSAHSQRDFPPLWDPPPRVGYGETAPPLWDVLNAIPEPSAAPWVRAAYLEKLRQLLGKPFNAYELPAEDAGRIAALLKRLPEGPVFVIEFRETLDRLTDRGDVPRTVIDELRAMLDEAAKRRDEN